LELISSCSKIYSGGSNKVHRSSFWAECIDGCIQVVTHTDMMHNVSVAAIVGLTHFMQENAASDSLYGV
jgi:hypothetical protein